MAIGTILFHSRHGKLIVTKKAYSPVSNSVVWYASDVTGTERPLDGTERTEAEVRAEESATDAASILSESKDKENELIKTMFSHMKLVKGAKGDRGDDGKTGARGFRGEKGDEGKKGDKGDAGKDGKDGKKGDIGPKGDRGPQGEKGEKGDTGKDGKDGNDGKDGRDGLNGLNGGGGIHKIDDADDVRIASPTSGQALTYNATTKKWENGTVSGTSHDEVTLVGEDFLSLTGQAITANPIDLDNLSATGTPSATTFLRGDNSWATPSSSGGIVRTVTTSSGAFTAGGSAGTDYVYLIAGAHAVALPTAVSNTNRYTFKNNHSAAITITPDGAETIEGAASIQVAPEDSVDLISNNANWFVI